MTECCRTCRHRLDLRKWDYSHGGCVHKKITDGFICMSCAHEGVAIWMVGTDEDTEFCECYERRVCLHCGSGGDGDADGETPLSAEFRPVQADIDDAYYEYGRKRREGER